MSVTVVGSIALDSVETPSGANDEGLGGAATYFALGAANYAEVHLIGVVGEDFPPEHVSLFESRNIDLEGLERAPGKTFRWAGRYHDDINFRYTLDTQLNVFEHFHPKLTERARNAKYLFLGNIHPSLQLEVLEQTTAHFVALDTMNLWIDIALDDLKNVLKRVHAIVVNDSEVRELTGESNLIKGMKALRRMGPGIVVMKKGEHGCVLLSEDDIFVAPAFPLESVVDPTGAGDTFAGGFMGYVAKLDSIEPATLRQAVIHGSVVASYACQAFGPDRLAAVTEQEIDRRYQDFRKLSAF